MDFLRIATPTPAISLGRGHRESGERTAIGFARLASHGIGDGWRGPGRQDHFTLRLRSRVGTDWRSVIRHGASPEARVGRRVTPSANPTYSVKWSCRAGDVRRPAGGEWYRLDIPAGLARVARYPIHLGETRPPASGELRPDAALTGRCTRSATSADLDAVEEARRETNARPVKRGNRVGPGDCLP